MTEKRVREEPESESAAKRVRVERLGMVYGVQVTRFLDDYKSRGDDWASTDMDFVYATLAQAEEAAHEEKRKYVVDYITSNMDTDEAAKYYNHYSDDDDNDEEEPELDLSAIDEDFDALIEKAQEGEYVARRFDVTIVYLPIIYPESHGE